MDMKATKKQVNFIKTICNVLCIYDINAEEMSIQEASTWISAHIAEFRQEQAINDVMYEEY